MAQRREQAEEAFAAHSRVREALAGELFAARSAAERIGMRLERARDVERASADGAERRRGELAALEESAAEAGPDDAAAERVAALERELESLERERERRLERELAELGREREAAAERLEELRAVTAQRRAGSRRPRRAPRRRATRAARPSARSRPPAARPRASGPSSPP